MMVEKLTECDSEYDVDRDILLYVHGCMCECLLLCVWVLKYMITSVLC